MNQSLDRYEAAKETKILARNNLNKNANELVPLARAWIAQFVGQKLYFANGSLVKKAKDTLPVYKKNGFVWRIDTILNSVYVFFEQCENVPSVANQYSTCVYEKNSYYLGELVNDNVLKGPNRFEFCPYRTDYNMAEIREKLAQIKELEEKISKIRDTMGEFRDGVSAH